MTQPPTPPGLLAFCKRHLPALLYGWFWIGLAMSGWLAPADRVAMLESGLVTEGWHLTVMALIFGTVTLGAYALRMSGRWGHRVE